MDIERIVTPNAPTPPQNFSHAVIAGGVVYCAGVAARHPETGEVVGDTIEEQIEQTMQNLKAILEASGSSMDKVVRTIVYLKDYEYWAALTPYYEKYFANAAPSRAAVVISEFGRKGLMVEIVATAVL